MTYLDTIIKKVGIIPFDFAFGTTEKYLALLIALPLGAMMIDYFLSRSVVGYGYRFFVAPGVIVHEAAHAFGCLITGAKITAFNVFEKEGGQVEHHKPKLAIIGQIIISLAPLFAGAAAIYYLAKLVGFHEIDLIGIPLTPDGIRDAVLKLINSIDTSDKKNWLLLYLLISIAVTMVPSKQDLKNIAISIIVLIVLIVLVYKFTTFRLNPVSHIPPQLIMVVGTIDLLLLLMLASSIIIFVLTKLFKR